MSAAAFLEANGLSRVFETSGAGFLRSKSSPLKAVDSVNISLAKGKTLGLVGESGCGKSTLGRLLLGLLAPTSGTVRLDGVSMQTFQDATWRKQRARAQLVYQDSLGALDRRLQVGYQIAEPMIVHGVPDGPERDERVAGLLLAVGLNADMATRYPHELSGGQRQRVVLARALSVRPSFLVCDEPISALDVSIQAQIINLFLHLKDELDLTMVFISHDLKAVCTISDNIAVMYLGRIVEMTNSAALVERPLHPYTQALVSAIPRRGRGRGDGRIILSGEPPNPRHVPSGCSFHPRCQFARGRCRIEAPALRTTGQGTSVACHFAEEISELESAA